LPRNDRGKLSGKQCYQSEVNFGKVGADLKHLFARKSVSAKLWPIPPENLHARLKLDSMLLLSMLQLDMKMNWPEVYVELAKCNLNAKSVSVAGLMLKDGCPQIAQASY